MGPQCGVDPLDFLLQRPPLPGLLRGVEAHMRSTCYVRSTVSFSAVIPAEFPEGTYRVLLGALALRRL